MKREPEFLSELDARKLRGHERAAILLADFGFYSAHLDREIWARKGFVTNFASVPRLPLAYWLFGGVADEAAVIHDLLYTNEVQGITRKQADEVFSEAMAVCGTPAWRRGPMWLGVRLFGSIHWGTGSPVTQPAPKPDGDPVL